MRLIVKDFKHWRFKFELMRFGILIMVVVIFWVGIELYSTYNSTALTEDYSKEIEPLSPALDLDMIEQLEKRSDLSEDFNVVLPQNEVEIELSQKSSDLKTQPSASASSQVTGLD